ncbi:hypothetical protein ACLOJK_039053, partial [Asimina triloba]
SDVCVGCALIDMFARSEDLQYVRSVFERMIERNVVVWTLMITSLTQCGSTKDAVDLFIEMEVSGFIPDQFALSSAISACTELGIIQLGQQLHSHAILAGLISFASVGCSLVNMYVNCAVDGSVDASMRVFDQMLMHDVMSWTAIITGYVQSSGRDKEAIELFCSMKQEGVQPNQFTFSSVLKACANLSDADLGEQVYAQVVKSGLASVNCVGNSFVAMYTHSGKFLTFCLKKSLISYNIMVDGYTKNLDSEEAFELQQIENAGVGPCAFTFASLLSAAARIGALGKGTLKVVVYAVTYVKQNYGNPTVMLSENGMDYADPPLPDGLYDFERISYYQSYLLQLKKAIDEGANVVGYLAWSLLDNFEWLSGYTSRFGLVYVDYKTQKRYPKMSALWFKKMIQPKKN